LYHREMMRKMHASSLPDLTRMVDKLTLSHRHSVPAALVSPITLS
jgi:hypothetical protein